MSVRKPARIDYLVTWEIDIEEVDSALAAALEAHRIMLEVVDLLPEEAGGLPSSRG